MSWMRATGSPAPARRSSSLRTLSVNSSGFFPARLSRVMIGVRLPSNTRTSPSSVRSMRGARSRNSGDRYSCHASSGIVTCESDEMSRYSVMAGFLFLCLPEDDRDAVGPPVLESDDPDGGCIGIDAQVGQAIEHRVHRHPHLG